MDDDPQRQETTEPALLRRQPRGLLWFWLIGLVIAGFLFWISRAIPALEELVTPGYWVVGIALVAFTIRWFRPRGVQRRRRERRRGNRRGPSDTTW